MIITVIGNHNCTRCEVVKNILDNRKVEYEYKILSDLNKEEKEKILSKARSKGIMQMPVIIKDDEVVELSEV